MLVIFSKFPKLAVFPFLVIFFYIMVFCIKFLILVSYNNFYHNILFFLYTSKIKSKNFEFQEGKKGQIRSNSENWCRRPFGCRQMPI